MVSSDSDGWLGPAFVNQAMTDLGFTALDSYVEFWRDRCGKEDLYGTIDRYWNELSLEYMSSAGFGNGGSALFRGANAGSPGYYRSEYLDYLERESINWIRPGEIAPRLAIHPCKYEDILQVRHGPADNERRSLEKVIDRCKASASHINFPMVRPIEAFQDAAAYLNIAAEKYGLTEFDPRPFTPNINRCAFSIKVPNRPLEIYLGMESRRRGARIPSPTVETFMLVGADNPRVIDLKQFRNISEPMAAYSMITDDRSALINIYAVVSFAKILSDSFL